MKLRTILVNFASMASLRVGLAAMTFGLFWLLSRHFTTFQLGGFSLLMNAFFMVQTMPLLGMTMPLTRRVAARPGTVAAETSSSFFFALPPAIALGAGLVLAGCWYSSDGLVWPFALLGISMLPTAFTTVGECVLVGQEKMQGIALINLAEALGRLLGAWATIHWNLGLTGLFSVFAVLRYAAAMGYLCNPHVPLPRWRDAAPAMMDGYRREVPTYLSIAVVTALCARVDIVLISKLLSIGMAGVYAAAARISDAALMVPTMAAVVMFPTQARLFEADPAGFGRFLFVAVRWCLIGGFALAMLVIALSPSIIHVLYAPKLWPSAAILQILILGATLMVIDQLLSTTMLASHSQTHDLRSMSIGLAALVVLLVALTHWFGLLGSAAAVPAALLVRVFYRLYWAQHKFANPFLLVAARVVAAAAIAVGVFFAHLGANPGMDLLLAGLVYTIALWAFRSVRGTDLRAIRGLIPARRGLRA